MKLKNELKEIKKEVENKFSDINFSFDSMCFDVELEWDTISIDIKENNERWSPKIVNVSFRKNSWLDNPKIEFNYGTGGWNPGDLIKQLSILSESFTAATTIAKILNENKEYFLEVVRRVNHIKDEIVKIIDIKLREESLEKLSKLEYLAHNISKKLEIYKNLEEVCENSSYKKEWEWFTEVLLLETKMDGVIVWKTIIEYKKFDKEVYKLKGKRISKNNLMETIKNGVYMVPIKHEKNYRIFNRVYRNIEEFETALNN